MKSAVFDIESTDLAAVGAGWILGACIKPERGATISLRYDDLHCVPGNEKRLVKELLDALAEYDILIGHHIRRFDWPFIKSRARLLGVPVKKYPLFYDTLDGFKRTGWRTVLNVVGKPTARIDHIWDFLFGDGRHGENPKTALYPREHWTTVWGTTPDRRRAMDKLDFHCRRDVKMNEDIFMPIFEADPARGLRPLT